MQGLERGHHVRVLYVEGVLLASVSSNDTYNANPHSNLSCMPPAPHLACTQPLQGQLTESIGNLTNLLAM